MGEYDAQDARDAEAFGVGGRSYWDYLEQSAKDQRDYYLARGDAEMASLMMSRSLSQALAGNDGD